MWRGVLAAVLTAVRFLAPAALLVALWGQCGVVSKLLKHLDWALRSVIFPSDAKRDSVLRWVAECGPVEVESLEQVWRQGWLVCALVERALPGACGGHRLTPLSIQHGQSLAEQYLGVKPEFSRQELESNEPLTSNQEYRLAHYLESLRLALNELSPPFSKPKSPRVSPESQAYTLDYVARGMGLCAAQTGKKMCFKIYPTAQQCLEPGEINILIRGPRETCGTVVVRPIFGRAQLLRQEFLGLNKNPQYTERALPITQGTAYLRSYGKRNINKAFYVPKLEHAIDIEVSVRRDHTRVTYSADMDGIYEISLTSRGYNLIGSPFRVMAAEDNIEYNTSTELDDDNECGIIDVKNDRRIVFRIVDFVTEKMLLNENGTLEKISDIEATKLIAAVKPSHKIIGDDEKTKRICEKICKHDDRYYPHLKRFQKAAQKIINLIKICDRFAVIMNKKHEYETKFDTNIGIPDIVNSMIFDRCPKKIETNPKCIEFNLTNDKLEQKNSNYEVHSADLNPILTNVNFFNTRELKLHEQPLRTKKSHSSDAMIQIVPETSNMMHTLSIKEKENYKVAHYDFDEEKRESSMISSKIVYDTTNSGDENLYEHENSKSVGNSIIDIPINERTNDLSAIIPIQPEIHHIDIVIENYNENQEVTKNPFIDGEYIERPKTPILKIITGNVNDIKGPLYLEPKYAGYDDQIPDEELRKSNEFLNPFFMHGLTYNDTNIDLSTSQPVTEFLIGAPVSLPEIRKAPSPEPNVENFEDALCTYDNKKLNVKQVESMVCSKLSPMSSESHLLEQTALSSENESFFHSTESFSTEPTIDSMECTNRFVKVDSAYVSIDDSNSSPDSNNNNDTQYKPKLLEDGIDYIDYSHDLYLKMGPAEREIWQNCGDICSDCNYNNSQSDSYEVRREIFTPIADEGKGCSAMTTNKESDSIANSSDSDMITEVMTELDDIYRGYFNSSEINSLPTPAAKDTPSKTNYDVDSASEFVSDVKRHHTDEMAAAISEVQSLATESISVSRALDSIALEQNVKSEEKHEKIVFGETSGENFVIQRKRYWDERITLLEEMIAQQNEKRSNKSKFEKYDSTDMKKGKSMMKHNLSKTTESQITEKNKNYMQSQLVELHTDINYVKKWKQFWDQKLATEDENNHSKHTLIIAEKNKNLTDLVKVHNVFTETEIHKNKDVQPKQTPKHSKICSPIKFEVSDEQVLKAFETSPKRFFGNSRNNILEKIDSCLLDESKDKEAHTDSQPRHNNGIVSSRISMFNIINQDSENLHKSKTEFAKLRNTKIAAFHDHGETKSNEIKYFSRDQHKDKKEITVNVTSNAHNIPTNTTSDIKKQRKISASKSEMDIFSKVQSKTEDKICIHKSCGDLPKVNVRNVITLFESGPHVELNVHNEPIKVKKKSKLVKDAAPLDFINADGCKDTGESESAIKDKENNTIGRISSEINVTVKQLETPASEYYDCKKEESATSTLDINSPNKTPKTVDYKHRFQTAKEFFKSLEELSIDEREKPPKLNECEMILYSQSTESLPPPRRQKKNLRAHSAPTSECEYELFGDTSGERVTGAGGRRLIKISEKFQVDDLFNDVAGDGKLSREGSFRGIPHKHAVLATFKSMENITDMLSSYDLSDSQMCDFAEENCNRPAQIYHTEYPYLPRTDPSKYRSRVDSKASGLISRKELLKCKTIPRRNSVPDILILNERFTTTL